MHYGSKGWYVAELKKQGITHHEGRKLASLSKQKKEVYFLFYLLIFLTSYS